MAVTRKGWKWRASCFSGSTLAWSSQVWGVDKHIKVYLILKMQITM